jgi:uncharacterized protein YrrD
MRGGVMILQKYSEVVGLPVICINCGKKAGTIEDIIFCPGTRAVKGFLLERKGYELSKKAILLAHVVNIGDGAVLVEDCRCINALKNMEQDNGFKDKGELRGLRIYTKSGQDLGIVKDILFDYKTETIEGLEISDGLIQDIVEGRNILPLIGRVEFAEEHIIVEKEAAEEMISTGGGIKRKLLGEE